MNRHVDAYATITQKIAIEGDSTVIRITRRTTPSTITEMLPTYGSNNWKGKIRKQLDMREGQLILVKLA